MRLHFLRLVGRMQRLLLVGRGAQVLALVSRLQR